MNCSLKSPVALTAYALALFSCSQSALACSASPYIGAVCFTAASYCPQGYQEANGQAMQVQQSQALYSLITRFYTPAATPATAFNLPDMRGRSPVGTGVGPGNNLLSLGQARGAETAVLTLSQMPVHNHLAAPGSSAFSLSATTNPGVSNVPSATNNQLATTQGPGTSLYAAAGGAQVPLAGINGSQTGTAVTVGMTGGALPVVTRSPQTVLRACIAVEGYYPPRA